MRLSKVLKLCIVVVSTTNCDQRDAAPLKGVGSPESRIHASEHVLVFVRRSYYNVPWTVSLR